MSLDKEAREFNERQKRYQEQEWQHKHMEGKDHRELMEVLNKIESGLGFLIDTITQWMEDREEQRKANKRRSSYGLYDTHWRKRNKPFDQDGGENPHL